MRQSHRNFSMGGIGVESTRAEIPSSLRTAPMLISLKFTSAIISLLVGSFLLQPRFGPGYEPSRTSPWWCNASFTRFGDYLTHCKRLAGLEETLQERRRTG